MSAEKPLRVRVFEALYPDKHAYRSDGDEWLWDREWSEPGQWLYMTPNSDSGERREVPRYDTDWAATGPLIERFQIDITHLVGHRIQALGCPCPGILAGHGCEHGFKIDEGPTELIAVCHLILALHEAGRLPR